MQRSRGLCLVYAVILATPLVMVANAQAQEDRDAETVLNSLGDSQRDLVYTPVTPCRIIDTRLAGGMLMPGVPRDFKVTGTDYSAQGGSATSCGVPFGPTTAAAINFVAVTPQGAGHLLLTPFGRPMPLASMINYALPGTGLNLANGLTVATCDPSTATCSSDITIQAGVSGVHLVADVQGYYRKTPGLSVISALANTALGDNALAANTTGYFNSAFGDSALQANTTGFHNSAFGDSALQANTTGAHNSAFGCSALPFNTTGYSNSAVGSRALYSNTTGYLNSAVGLSALYSNTTGTHNSAFGGSALAFDTTGAQNSAFGYRALYSNTTGAHNTALGFEAGSNLTSGDNNIYIANNRGNATESLTTRIGEGQEATYIAGIWGQTVALATGGAVFVDIDGKLGTILSSRRYKEDIVDMDEESSILMKLRPVVFYYKPEYDKSHIRQYGLVAEEVAQVAPQLVVYDKVGAPQTVRYHLVNAMQLNEVQKQRRQLEEQQTTIQDLKARLMKVEAALAGDR